MRTAISAFALAVALVVGTWAAAAERMAPAVVAIINYQRLEQDSAAAKTLLAQIGEYRTAYQAEITGQEDKLRAEAQELERQRTILSQEAFNDKRRAFETKTQELERQVIERNREFERAVAAARGELLKTVLAIVTDLASERGFNIVLDSSQALFVSKSLDLTQVVLDQLDKRLPKLAVSLPPRE
ncbi:MAG: OmpH family outer membrane protein [Alphaproteobacteria bacterium]|nr:OmpH family outer membrane protein [Alphaproteobacteria bacterium]